jgi:hypothetical protein
MTPYTRDCDCPQDAGGIRHQRGSCTDPVVQRFSWYADDDPGDRGPRVEVAPSRILQAPGGDPRHCRLCIYCQHGPYCLTCEPPASVPDDAHVCGPCREKITRSEISADPYYQGGGYDA